MRPLLHEPGPAGATATPPRGQSLAIEQRVTIAHAVTQALDGARDLAHAAPLIVRAICEELGWACGSCWLQDEQDRLSCVGTWGPGNEEMARFLEATRSIRHTREGGGLVRTVWVSGEPVWMGDVGAVASFKRRELAGRARLQSAFAFPIAADGRVLGVVELFSYDVEDADDGLLASAHDIGSQIGQFCLRAQAQAALRESERRFADTIERAAIGIAHVDGGGRFLHVNRAQCELLGYAREELLGMTVKDVSHGDDRDVTNAQRARLWAGEIDSFQSEKRYLHKSGRTVWVQLTISVQRDAAGQPLHDISIAQDISARKLAESALQLSETRFRNLVELSSDWYWELDAELRFTTFGGRGRSLSYEQRLRGLRPWEVPGTRSDCGWADLRSRLEHQEPFRDFEYAYVDARGQARHVSASGEPLRDGDGRFAGYRGVSRDIGARKRAEERIQYLASHDSLTGMPNRVMFAELLNHVLALSRRYGRQFAVLFIDLDRFKFINDSMGHDAGDTLLREVARRLKKSVRASDVVARLGGDEFVMLVQDLRGREHAARVARKVLSAVIKPIAINGQECRVTASIGVSVFPQDAQDEATLMTHADIAMYHAKSEGKNNFQFYDTRLELQSLERLKLESHLRRAIERGELSLHYQAQVDLASDRICGVEALLRWNSPELGAVSPAQFIPVAEETGLILSIGHWVLRQACLQSVAWQRAGLPAVRVAVNLSPRQLTDPELVAQVRAVLDETGLAPHLLELEVTESSVMHHMERALQVLHELKAMGLHLAIDDFGTGYSSLAQLRSFPIDTLKVDRSFIRELPGDSEGKAIAEAIIAMGRTLGLNVVAEGVETPEQRAFLRERSCDQMQGYYFSRPVSASQFGELMRAQPVAAAASAEAAAIACGGRRRTLSEPS